MSENITPDREGRQVVPWANQQAVISLGGIDDCEGFLRIEIRTNEHMRLWKSFNMFIDSNYFNKLLKRQHNDHDKEIPIFEDIDIEAAVQLRDFLNYAVPVALDINDL